MPLAAAPLRVAAPESARLALREATRSVHERLHVLPVFAALAAGTLDRPRYVALLARLFGFHAPMERALACVLRARIPPETWQRAHLLTADLATFGVGERELAAFPTIRPPHALSEPAAMGCLYVIEGSALGGRQLARQLGGVVPDAGNAGRRFLRSAEQPGRLRWSAFCAMLDEVGAEPGPRAALVGGALETFAQFETWFAGVLQT